jgi:hypothetical protein
VFAFLLPVFLFARRERSRGMRLMLAAGAGIGVAQGLWAVRNYLVSGMPLPATFYAKVHASASVLSDQLRGFSELLPDLAFPGSVAGVIVLLVAALTLLVRAQTAEEAAPPGACVAGLVFCAVSFALIRPVDPPAFYHQRYVLPALPFLVAPLPMFLAVLLRRLPNRRADLLLAGAGVVLAAALFVVAPSRFRRLANDAQNIDEVQVNVGRSLNSAAADDVVWATDAGAVRYFGNAFVVDMMGLNSPELLGTEVEAFLQARSPAFIEAVPGWSSVDRHSAELLHVRAFRPNTPYTVTSFTPMQEHGLYECRPGHQGWYRIWRKRFHFVCPSERRAQ